MSHKNEGAGVLTPFEGSAMSAKLDRGIHRAGNTFSPKYHGSSRVLLLQT